MHVHSIKTFLSLIGRLLSKKEVRGQTERVLATHVDCNKISSLCLQLEKLNQIFTQRVFQPNICVEGNILQQCPVSPVSRVQWPENILPSPLSHNVNLPRDLKALASSMWVCQIFRHYPFVMEKIITNGQNNSTNHNYYSLCTIIFLVVGFQKPLMMLGFRVCQHVASDNIFYSNIFNDRRISQISNNITGRLLRGWQYL